MVVVLDEVFFGSIASNKRSFVEVVITCFRHRKRMLPRARQILDRIGICEDCDDREEGDCESDEFERLRHGLESTEYSRQWSVGLLRIVVYFLQLSPCTLR